MLAPDHKPFRGYTARDLQECAERETNKRRYVYSKRVLENKMSTQVANAEINMMAAIAEHFAELAKKERLL